MRICRLDELPDPGARSFRVGGDEWPLRGFVVRKDGGLHAYVNRCPHAGHPLDLIPDRLLTADAGLIQCSSHGAQFRIEDGECVAGPCPGRSLMPLPLAVRDGWLELDGDPEILASRYA